MQLPSPSARPSSTDLTGSAQRLRAELIAQGRFLDGLVRSLEAVNAGLDAPDVLERTAQEGRRMFAADAAVVLAPGAGERVLRPVAAAGVALGPIAELEVSLDELDSPLALAANDCAGAAVGAAGEPADQLCLHLRPRSLLAAPLLVRGDLHALLVLLRLRADSPYGPSELSQAMVFCDFAARAAENVALFERVEALLAQARIREAERADLSRRLVSAEQEERRRLSWYLHDGPVQTLSGVAMMLDAVAEELDAGNPAGARSVLDTARARQRDVVRDVRELSFVVEPWTLRDQGFGTALKALADQFESGHRVQVELDVDAAEALRPDDQVCLFQIVREAMQNALKHATPSVISVAVHGAPQEGVEARVTDDGSGISERPDDGLPHHGIASMRERSAVLGGRLDIDSAPAGGTVVRVLIPPGALEEATDEPD